jgi:hypothetical protein
MQQTQRSAYSAATQFQENVHIVFIFKKSMKTDNVFVVDTTMNADFLGHLRDKAGLNMKFYITHCNNGHLFSLVRFC